MTNKDTFLSNIQNKLSQALLPDSAPEHPGSFQGYSFQVDAPTDDLVARFTTELEALAGHVYLADTVEVIVEHISMILESHQTKTMLAWHSDDLGVAGLTKALETAGITIKQKGVSAEKKARSHDLAELGDLVIGLTGASGGVADLGTLALISGAGRGRLASLLPPVHIALLSRRKLYPSLPAFLADHPQATTQGSNLVFIAGPSRTGDIELTLTMGVHGPGEVYVIIMP